MSGEILDIVYDGRCRFCARALAVCTRLARRAVFRLHDANDRESVGSRFPALAEVDTESAMFVITDRGEVFRGFFAFRRMMWASPWLHSLLPLFYAPGASIVGPRIYAWVARHRQSLGCTTACSASDAAPRPRR